MCVLLGGVYCANIQPLAPLTLLIVELISYAGQNMKSKYHTHLIFTIQDCWTESEENNHRFDASHLEERLDK